MTDELSTSAASDAASGAQTLAHRIRVSDVYTIDDVTAYYQQRRGRDSGWIPMLGMSAAGLNHIAPLLERLRRTNLAAFRDLWIMPADETTYAITSNIESDAAGELACAFFREHAVTEVEKVFTAELQCICWRLQTERRLWVAAGQPICQIQKIGAPIRGSFGDN